MIKPPADKMILNLRDPAPTERLAGHLAALLRRQEGLAMRPLIALCIGSDRYTGDALGPLVGTLLEEQGACIVYGNLDRPVHAGNLVETINIIGTRYLHPIIIAIDACLGKSSEIGNIEAWEGGVEAGIAVGNRLPCIGHISVVGVVNAGSQLGYLDLQSTPLSIVVKLSRAIGEALTGALRRLAICEAAAVLSPPSGEKAGPK